MDSPQKTGACRSDSMPSWLDVSSSGGSRSPWMLKDVENTPRRRMVAWEYAAANSSDSAGVVRGPTPFGASQYTDYVPVGLGVQGHVLCYMNWATGARPGAGLRKLLFYPEFTWNLGTITPDGISDANKPQPVLAPNSNTRLTTAGLGSAYSSSTPVIPMVYKSLGVAAAEDVQMRIVELELCQVRYGLWRAEDPGAAYEQAASWEDRVWGQTPQTPRSGTTEALLQMPLEKSLRWRIGWEGADNVFTEEVFLAGDAISLFYCYGAPA